MKQITRALLAACAVAPLLSPASQAEMAHIGKPGELHFSIRIIQGTCILADSMLEVDLGTLYLHRSRGDSQGNDTPGTVLGEKPFALELEECGDVARAYVKMDGEADGDDDTLFKLSGGARGVALKLSTAAGQQQRPQPLSAAEAGMQWNLVKDQNNRLDYVAQYVVTQNNPQAGHADALVNFSITYE
ncbi:MULTISPECIES: fimbrial protein [Yersiniaceae]|uniref:fimbrial protein n=1 Tax=Yersiniaceae TaxID=1903411 RepID=UPI000933BB1D|nr:MULTISPECIES: fimbrial protein [Yersiniaceae]